MPFIHEKWVIYAIWSLKMSNLCHPYFPFIRLLLVQTIKLRNLVHEKRGEGAWVFTKPFPWDQKKTTLEEKKWKSYLADYS